MVNRTRRLVRSAGRADWIVLAHGAAAACLCNGREIWLPAQARADVNLISEAAFGRWLDAPDAPPAPAPVPSLDHVGRLSGLDPQTCRTLALFDVITPAGAAPAYPDLATARQVARLLAEGVPLAAVVDAATAFRRRGLRLCQVRLGASPWGEIVQLVGGAMVRLDGQYALPLDDVAAAADEEFIQARACEDVGDLEQAERRYRRAERLDRSDPVVPFNLGNILAAQDRAPEAKIAFRRALQRDRGFAEAGFNLARLQEATGQTAAAIDVYRATLATHPAFTPALYNCARLLTRLQAYDEAFPLWDRFIALAPDDPDIGHARRLALLCRIERATS